MLQFCYCWVLYNIWGILNCMSEPKRTIVCVLKMNQNIAVHIVIFKYNTFLHCLIIQLNAQKVKNQLCPIYQQKETMVSDVMHRAIALTWYILIKSYFETKNIIRTSLCYGCPQTAVISKRCVIILDYFPIWNNCNHSVAYILTWFNFNPSMM